MKLSIIIPAYNEEDRIIHTLNTSLAFLNQQNFNSEIIVVSDGSTDNTRSVVKGFDAGGKVALRVIEYHPNRGKGYAVRTGMLAGNGEMILFMDADYAVPIEEITKGIYLIESGFDVAMGSRALSGSVVADHQNLFRELSAKLYTLIQMAYLGIFSTDTQCGFKIFRHDVAAKLFSKSSEKGWAFDVEILYLAQLYGYEIVEVPVNWHEVEGSKVNPIKDSMKMLLAIFRIRRKHSGFINEP